MTEDIFTSSFLVTYEIAEKWVKNGMGKVYIGDTRVQHYQVGILSITGGLLLKVFTDKRHDSLANALLGAGTAAVWHDRADLMTDVTKKQWIFKYF